MEEGDGGVVLLEGGGRVGNWRTVGGNVVVGEGVAGAVGDAVVGACTQHCSENQGW